MRINPHPLRDAEIMPAPEPYQVDPLSEAVHTRGGTRVPLEVRALPTARTTRGHPRWRWGPREEAPRSTSTPLIMSPSDLEAGRRRESSAYGTIDELRARLKR
jgi:hypothetical protein